MEKQRGKSFLKSHKKKLITGAAVATGLGMLVLLNKRKNDKKELKHDLKVNTPLLDVLKESVAIKHQSSREQQLAEFSARKLLQGIFNTRNTTVESLCKGYTAFVHEIEDQCNKSKLNKEKCMQNAFEKKGVNIKELNNALKSAGFGTYTPYTPIRCTKLLR